MKPISLIAGPILMLAFAATGRPVVAQDANDQADLSGPVLADTSAPTADSEHSETIATEPSLSPVPRPKFKPFYKLEWVAEPELVRGFGEQKLVSATIDTGDQPKDVKIAKNFSHTFNYDAGDNEPIEVDEEELRALLLHNTSFNMLKKHKTNMTTARGKKTLIQTKVLPKRRTKSVVMFRDNTIELRGRVRRIIDHERGQAAYERELDKMYRECLDKERSSIGQVRKSECQRLKLTDVAGEEASEEPVQVGQDQGQEFDLVVRSTEVCPKGNPFGTYSLEHYGTDLFKHPSFYTLTDRFVRFGGQADTAQLGSSTGILELNGASLGGQNSSKNFVKNVMSPYDCAALALAANKSIALYDMNAISCLFNDQPHIEPKSLSKSVPIANGTNNRSPSGEYLYSGAGAPLGAYQLSKSAMLSRNSDSISADDEVSYGQASEAGELKTGDKQELQKWISEHKCDLINLKEATYNCVRFTKRLAHMLMFRQQVEGLPKNNGSSVQ